MKKPKAKSRETRMYESVKAYFKKELGCKHVYADLPDGEVKIHLPRNLCKRDPDVVGITEEAEIHLAEGKLLSRGGQPFEQCVEQALSLRGWADHLYVFFPLEEWKMLSHDDADSNRKYLRDRGVGLLLVEESGKCKSFLSAPQNAEADDAKKDSLRRKLGILQDEFLPSIPNLSTAEASNARALVDCFRVGSGIADEVAPKVFKSNKSQWKFDVITDDGKSSKQRQSILRYLKGFPGNLWIELDFFGGYARDGHCCIWISREVSRQQLLERVIGDVFQFGTYFWDEATFSVLNLNDQTPERICSIIREGEKGWIMHKVEFLGRSRNGLARELETLLRAAKKLT